MCIHLMDLTAKEITEGNYAIFNDKGLPVTQLELFTFKKHQRVLVGVVQHVVTNYVWDNKDETWKNLNDGTYLAGYKTL